MRGQGFHLLKERPDGKTRKRKLGNSINQHDGALVFGANFSIGVNVFYRMVEQAARLMSGLDQYQAFIAEEHHSRKRDAPSGTALKLKELMAATSRSIFQSRPFAPAIFRALIALALILLRIRSS